MTQTASGPVILCVLDGWGNAPKNRYNAISNAKTPVWDKILKNYPNGELLTSGLAVGLPEGQMGNSEVGHMSMGSGRVVLQDLPRIDNAIKEKQLYNKKTIFLKLRKKMVHVIYWDYCLPVECIATKITL
jgi:2,3-bisphosphoglycerate-independent phosphoglycerate mutase